MRIVLIILAILLSVISFGLIAICIDGLIEYAGRHMGNEAYGFQSFFTLLAIVFTVPAIILWIYIIRSSKKQESPKDNK